MPENSGNASHHLPPLHRSNAQANYGTNKTADYGLLQRRIPEGLIPINPQCLIIYRLIAWQTSGKEGQGTGGVRLQLGTQAPSCGAGRAGSPGAA